MKKLINSLIKYRKLIIILYLIIAIVCVFFSLFVKVNYNMADYLPDSAKSTIALDIMKENYDSEIANARVMIEDIELSQASEVKKALKQIDGINEVVWLDDQIDIYQPIEMQETSIVETYYKDHNAIFTLTIDQDKAIQVMADIRALTNKKISFTGDAISTAEAIEATTPEIQKITLIAIIIIFIILFLTTTSWTHPLIFMFTIGIAVLINRGTNLMLGEISFVSNAAGSILQLAVSMDYSIFLMNRFIEYRKSGLDVNEAITMALTKSFSSISASSLTTIIGFASLMLMRFKIGVDLGLVMSKAVLISIIIAFTLLPAVIIETYKLIERFEHRSFVPSFTTFTKVVEKIKKPAVIIFILLLVPSYLLQNFNSFNYGSSHIFSEGSKYYEDTQNIQSIFGKSTSLALMLPLGNEAVESDLSTKLQQLPYVSNIISYVDLAGASIPKEYIDSNILKQLDSDDYTRMVITIQCDEEGTATFKAIDQIRGLAKEYYNEDYQLAGSSVSTEEMKEITTADMVKVNFVAIIAVFLIIMLTTKSLLLPLILVVVIEGAIWVNLAISASLNKPLFYISYLIISSIQLGATVDYAICYADRYLESRKTRKRPLALNHTIRYTVLPVLTSGSILTIAGLILGIISSHGVLSELGILLFRGTLLSLLFVLFVLPGLLYWLDKPILRFSSKRKEVVSDEEN